ncbi:MAG: hypothetical protein JNL42_00005, partial [Anaerolineae bacterium]|nr:hypothetical protein [Anaerolineae bacterium]
YCHVNNTYVYSATQLQLVNSANRSEYIARIDRAIETAQKLIAMSPATLTVYHERYKQYLAQFLDTKAWLIYLTADPGDAATYLGELEEARRLIAEEALKHDQDSAILYYHLTRLHLTMLERLWQSTELEAQNLLAARKAMVIDDHLTKALRYWLNAARCDHNRRFRDRLTWIGRKLHRYRTAWNERHFRTFSGTAEEPSSEWTKLIEVLQEWRQPDRSRRGKSPL